MGFDFHIIYSHAHHALFWLNKFNSPLFFSKAGHVVFYFCLDFLTLLNQFSHIFFNSVISCLSGVNHLISLFLFFGLFLQTIHVVHLPHIPNEILKVSKNNFPIFPPHIQVMWIFIFALWFSHVTNLHIFFPFSHAPLMRFAWSRDSLIFFITWFLFFSHFIISHESFFLPWSHPVRWDNSLALGSHVHLHYETHLQMEHNSRNHA